MSLYKGIEGGKEKRKKYYGSEAHDPSCRPHGGCVYCEQGRLHSNLKRKLKGVEHNERGNEGDDQTN